MWFSKGIPENALGIIADLPPPQLFVDLFQHVSPLCAGKGQGFQVYMLSFLQVEIFHLQSRPIHQYFANALDCYIYESEFYQKSWTPQMHLP